jgi:hypothetical protein
VANNVFFPFFFGEFFDKKKLWSLLQVIFRFRAKKMLIVRKETQKNQKKYIYNKKP